jgi:hypothetical protein
MGKTSKQLRRELDNLNLLAKSGRVEHRHLRAFNFKVARLNAEHNEVLQNERKYRDSQRFKESMQEEMTQLARYIKGLH